MNDFFKLLALRGLGGSGSGGATSWEDLGEETVGGDTLTWDGNTEGRYIWSESFVKVSEAMPAVADMNNGGSFEMGGHTVPFSSADVVDIGGAVVISNGVLIFYEDSVGTTIEGVTVDEAGTFFAYTPYGTTSRLTITGYTGFATTVVHPIDPKYLPEVPFFDLVAMGLPPAEIDSNPAVIEVDASELVAALQKGAIKFRFQGNYAGMIFDSEVTAFATTSAAAPGVYQAVVASVFSSILFINLVVSAESVSVQCTTLSKAMAT